jgi:hypothetical protein
MNDEETTLDRLTDTTGLHAAVTHFRDDRSAV